MSLPGRNAMASSSLMWHPASLLLSWVLFAMALQWVTLGVLFALTAILLLVAGVLAKARTFKLLRRARWLLLSLMVLFVLLTPGEYVPGMSGELGITYEGLRTAVEHLARLVAMLASLALLHQRLGTQGLMAGLYSLLAPFSWGRITVVRLMLVLECLEQKPAATWREWLDESSGEVSMAEACLLEVRELAWRDRIMMGAALLGMIWLVVMP